MPWYKDLLYYDQGKFDFLYIIDPNKKDEEKRATCQFKVKLDQVPKKEKKRKCWQNRKDSSFKPSCSASCPPAWSCSFSKLIIVVYACWCSFYHRTSHHILFSTTRQLRRPVCWRSDILYAFLLCCFILWWEAAEKHPSPGHAYNSELTNHWEKGVWSPLSRAHSQKQTTCQHPLTLAYREGIWAHIMLLHKQHTHAYTICSKEMEWKNEKNSGQPKGKSGECLP